MAQSVGTGTISGTITDKTQALVTTATVLVTNTDTGVSRTLPVNAAGIYVAPFLQPGSAILLSTPSILTANRWACRTTTPSC